MALALFVDGSLYFHCTWRINKVMGWGLIIFEDRCEESPHVGYSDTGTSEMLWLMELKASIRGLSREKMAVEQSW